MAQNRRTRHAGAPAEPGARVNVDRMRRALSRADEHAADAARRRWLAGLPEEHRRIHERPELRGACMICVRQAASQLGKRVGVALSAFGVTRADVVAWPAPPTIPALPIPPLPQRPPATEDPETYTRPDGRVEVLWMKPHLEFVASLPLSDAQQAEMVSRLNDVAVQAFDDAAEESGHVAELRALLAPHSDTLGRL